MTIRFADFDISAPDISGCPPPGLPEFPLIGRSNVGKSSLINMLTNRRELAKVSQLPGRTQLINFFTINAAWRLVDLPGYGYVRLPEGTREKFAGLISDYLTQRPVIRRVFVLIDSRHEPQAIDVDFVSWLAGCGLPMAFVFTKADKLKPAAVARNIDAFQEAVSGVVNESPPAFSCSAVSRAGRLELLRFIGDEL